MSELVKLRIEERGDVVVASLRGELDLSGAASAGESIADAVPSSARGLVIDLAGLGFMDSSGVAMLFNLVRHLGSRRQELHVVAPHGGPVARVLDIVEFRRAAPVHGRLEEALTAMADDSS